eukprot:TRINITY_DN460_c0_g1_i12.p1 TRINITY_DN460_c0_g1~~TRINITY_DN460_c0_g1_i12.p1  ORF type:complete len:451 (-),score=69.97 TRINITY_DN460_c0_g1_i12:266-1618(-)
MSRILILLLITAASSAADLPPWPLRSFDVGNHGQAPYVMQTTDLEIVWHNFTVPWDSYAPSQFTEVLISADGLWYMCFTDEAAPIKFFAFDPSNDSMVALYPGNPCDNILMLPNGSFAIIECGATNSWVNIMDSRLRITNSLLYAGPVVWIWLSMDGSVMFVGHCTDQAELTNCNITATNLATAETVWSTPIPVSHWQFAPGFFFPAISEDGSRIYVMITDPWVPVHSNMSAFSTSTGEQLWSRELYVEPGQPPCFSIEVFQALVVGCGDGSDGGSVFAGCGSGSVYSINGSDGSTKWTFNATLYFKYNSWGDHPPLPICGAGGGKQDVVVISADFYGYRYYVLDMQSGKRLNSDKDWQYSLIGPVADANGTLFMITGDNEEFGLTMYFTVIEPVTSTILAKYLMSDQNFGLMGMGSITPDGRYVNVFPSLIENMMIYEVRPKSHGSAGN